RLVTRALTSALDTAVDIWCPVVNLVDAPPGAPDLGPAPPRDRYDDRIARGERLWWYQSCLSHGCDVVGRGYFTGWPSLMVYAPPVGHRVWEWLTFRYRIGGELYFNTVEAYDHDPFQGVRRHGGNGDGTLFYPGRPALIGGR